jgi:copper chaperone CopZ
MATATPTPSAVRVRYRVSGMDCAACAQKINLAVRRVSGVADVSVSAQAGTMTVTILADTGATVLVTGNAMRLLAWRGS